MELKKITKTLAFKICLIGLLGFGLSIPLNLISSLTSERQSYSNQAVQEVVSKWGDAPNLYGPFISFESVSDDNSSDTSHTTEQHAQLPKTLNISGQLEEVKLKRGLFRTPVYKGQINLSGTFNNLDKVKTDQRIFLWNKAKLVFLVGDLRSLKTAVTLSVRNGQNNVAFRPGRDYKNYQSIEAPLHGILTSKENTEQEKHKLILSDLDFQFTFDLHGSKSLFFLPSGETTEVKLKSDWPHPKFTGDFLPTVREITKNGFSAEWNIPLFSRGLSETFHKNALHLKAPKAGVSFFEPTNVYVLNDRSLKYALISIAVVFLSVFIVELYSKQAVHWVQYMFVGFALVVFYFLLLGFSEHFGFERAYITASGATGLLIGVYIASVTGRFLRGLFVTVILFMIYASLYMLLNATDYAMLVGSVSVFTLLAVTMFTTRKVDWSNATLGER